MISATLIYEDIYVAIYLTKYILPYRYHAFLDSCTELCAETFISGRNIRPWVMVVRITIHFYAPLDHLLGDPAPLGHPFVALGPLLCTRSPFSFF